MKARDLARVRGELTAHVLFSVRTALEAVGHNTLRAALTSLGILFGVASVIAMLAIGKGAEAEILEQMKLLGSNNVIVTPLVEQKEEKAKDEGTKEPKKFSPGLTERDAKAIVGVVPNVNTASGEVVFQTLITREGRRRSGKVVGVDTTYFELFNLAVAEGKRFAAMQVADGAPVAIIGHGVKSRFFTTEEPIGKPIKVGGVWLTVVGVLEDRKVSDQTSQKLGIRDANMDVYVPLSTMLLRYRNRSLVTEQEVQQASRETNDEANATANEDTEQRAERLNYHQLDRVIVRVSDAKYVTEQDVQQASRQFNDDPNANANEDAEERAERVNYHQLDRVIVRVSDAKYVTGVADVMQRMLSRRHNQVIDFEISVPELLLKQQQHTKNIFNGVLAAIAAISLIVGGIGIMNIMLASILERIREIGVRRAVGASQRDILAQFLSEAVLISLAGGVAGIIIGGILSFGIERVAKIHTIVSALSVFIAFGVSITVGIVFGIVPAWRAAKQDPVVCLRYE